MKKVACMTPEQMKARAKAFALRIIRLTESLGRGQAAETIGRQLLRSGMSVGANYRAACRGRSTAEFVAKMGIVEEEIDECLFWMELLIEADLVQESLIADLIQECREILAITVSSVNTARGNKRSPRNKESAIRNPQSAI